MKEILMISSVSSTSHPLQYTAGTTAVASSIPNSSFFASRSPNSTAVPISSIDNAISPADSPPNSSGSHSSCGSVSSVPHPFENEDQLNTQLQLFPHAYEWVESLLHKHWIKNEDITFFMLHDAHVSSLSMDLKAALLLQKAVDIIASTKIRKYNRELFKNMFLFTISLEHSSIYEGLLHDDEISKQDFDAYIALFEELGVIYKGPEENSITLDATFHSTLKLHFYPELSSNGFEILNEYFACRVSEIYEQTNKDILTSHLQPYLKHPEQNPNSISYQVLKQYAERRDQKPLAKLWQERYALEKGLKTCKREPERSLLYLKLGNLSLQLSDFVSANLHIQRAITKLTVPQDKINSPKQISDYAAACLVYANFLSTQNAYDASINYARVVEAYFLNVSSYSCREAQILLAKNMTVASKLEEARKTLQAINNYRDMPPEQQADFFTVTGLFNYKTGDRCQAQINWNQADRHYRVDSRCRAKHLELQLLQTLCLENEQQLTRCTQLLDEIRDDFGTCHLLYFSALVALSQANTANQQEVHDQACALNKLLIVLKI